MRQYLLLLLPICLFAACASPEKPAVVTHYDKMTGQRTDLLSENLIEGEEETPRELIWLNASRVYKDREDFDYFLEVHYEATQEAGFIDIRPGQTLTILADGKELQFSGRGSMNRRHEQDGLVSEDAMYQVSADELRAISRANEVIVQVIGRNGVVQRKFAPANSERFKVFVENYVEGGA